MNKIGFVYHLDANSPGVQSGRPYSLITELRSRVPLQEIFPLDHSSLNWRKMLKAWNVLYRQRSLIDRHETLLRKFGAQIERELEREKPDLLFGPSTLPFSYLETDIPTTFCSDAPFRAMLNYYPAFTRLSPRQVNLSEELETRVLQRASLCVYPSKWAAEVAIKAYGLPAEKVKVLPFGANHGRDNTQPQVENWIEQRKVDGEIRLLFVSRDWSRKGGALVLELAEWLRQKGLTVRLDIVGSQPPVPLPSFAHLHLNLRASVPGEFAVMTELFQRAHFLLMPSRAEAYGMTLCEANAFGVPVISTETGGITEIVRPGRNGVMLPLPAEAPAYGEKILEMFSSASTYQAIAQSSFQEFVQRLNWKKFCPAYLEAADAIVSGRSAEETVEEATPLSFTTDGKVEKPLRVLYVSNDYYDPRNMRSWSGLPQFMWQALERQGVELTYVPLEETALGRTWRFAVIKFFKLFGKRYVRDRTSGLIRSYTEQIQRALAVHDVDFIFCPGTPPVANLDTTVPICFWVDATFAGMVGYYDSFTNLLASSLRRGHEVDQAVLNRASLALYSSQWAADTATSHYKVEPGRVHVVPFGANLIRPPTDAEVEALIKGRGTAECRLFFAGVDWKRKGADDAVRVCQALRGKGINAQLTIIGCEPPSGVEVPEGVEVLGFVDKRDALGMRQIERLFGESHFFILPTKAEAYGLVLCEAAAFGLPALTTRSGGIPSIIEDGRTGLLFEAGASPEEYASGLAAVWQPEKYLTLARAARKAYTERLNWDVAGRRVVELMRETISRQKEPKVLAAV